MLNCADKSAFKVSNPREFLCLVLFNPTRLKTVPQELYSVTMGNCENSFS